MRHCLTISILWVLSKESRWHAVHKDTAAVRAYDEVLDQVVCSDDLDDVREA